ncbi:hypothetical protein CVT26_003981, partial [Gymnopilus dilepis]
MHFEQGPGSTLADVVGPSPVILDLWNEHKLTPERAVGRSVQSALVAFWSLYWGRDVELDEDEWRYRNRTAQPASQSAVEEEREDMNGCFVLDFPFLFQDIGLETQKILVQKDYVRIYDAFEEWEAYTSSPDDIAPSVVVTGQPGIGMSVPNLPSSHLTSPSSSLTKRKIAVQANLSGCTTPSGAASARASPSSGTSPQSHRDADITPRCEARSSSSRKACSASLRSSAASISIFRRRVWTLVDADAGAGAGAAGADGDELEGESDGDGDGPSPDSGLPVPVDLVLHGSNLEVIYVSSPQRARWKRLEKTTSPTGANVHKMIHRVHMDDALDPTLTESIYNQFGPIPRLWYDLQSPPFKTLHATSLSHTISSLTPTLFSSLVSSTLFHAPTPAPLRPSPPPFLLLTRKDPTQPVSTAALAPPSPHVAGRLVDHMRRAWSREEVVRLYRWFVGCPGLQGLVGVVFGAFCRHVLEEGEGVILDVVPMGQSENRQVSGEIGHSREAAVEGAVRLEVKPTKVVEFD